MKTIDQLYAEYDLYCEGKRADGDEPLSFADFLFLETLDA